jgi:hypothetical protein
MKPKLVRWLLIADLLAGLVLAMAFSVSACLCGCPALLFADC